MPLVSTSHRYRLFFLSLALACLIYEPISAPMAIVIGMALALIFGNPLTTAQRSWVPRILGWSVALLGAGIPLRQVIDFGGRGAGISFVLIAVVLLTGIGLSRRFGIDEDTGILLSSGTAICGGSAIAATSGAIGAGTESTAIALAIVFLLNATAVILFPPLGHALGLSPEQFGIWASLAIHDTSSVVGAALAYGGGAEAIAVPMKLARALWIIPVAAALGAWTVRRRHHGDPSRARAAKKPWFIAGFIVLAAIFSAFPGLHQAGDVVAHLGRRGLVLVLFGIGASLTRDTIRRAGLRPFLLGCTLWLLISTASLAAILLASGLFAG